MFSKRFEDPRPDPGLGEIEDAKASAEIVRQLFRLDGWTKYVAPFLDTYKNETLAKLADPPAKGETVETRVMRDTHLRGCLQGQQDLLGFLADVLVAETEALKDVAPMDGEVDLEDTLVSRRFG